MERLNRSDLKAHWQKQPELWVRIKVVGLLLCSPITFACYCWKTLGADFREEFLGAFAAAFLPWKK